MPILSDIYSAGNTLKRRIGGLLDDPKGTLEQFVGQLRDDTNRNSDLMNQAGWGQIDRVKYTPEQRAAAQKQLADIGTNMAMSAATVWHGSPHKFSKFDSSKIGTGEGAQAYGHGLYLAESPDVATTYSNLRAAPNMEFHTASGRKLTGIEKSIADDMLSNGMASARIGAKANGPEWEAAFNRIKDENITRGSLYKVDLPDDAISKMLDWDKPLSQQHPDVQAIFGKSEKMTGAQALKAIEANPEQYFSQTMSGKDLTGAMIRPERGSSEFLRQKGIPGIRYLDGGSRGTGQGTSNFVVFPGNEGILKILERNGQPLGLLGD